MPGLPPLHNTQNTRWLKQNHPALYRQIQELTWVADGLSERERETIDELLYIGAGTISNLHKTLALPWVQDSITETEYDFIYYLKGLGYDNPEAATAVITMQFLETLEADDVLTIRGMAASDDNGLLSIILDHPALQNGITDADTTLVTAVSLINDADEIRRMLNPGYAAVETLSAGTELTPHLKISIVRTGSQARPETAPFVRDAVEFAERTMQQPLPVSHVIVVLNDYTVPPGLDFVGTNHGYAFGYKPEYEQEQDAYGKHNFQSGITHEVAHYFWRGNEDWIDEGLANVAEYVYGFAKGISPGLLKPRRNNCEAHDLEMLSEWNPGKGDPQFHCNYYLGEMLFLDLLENLRQERFNEKLREFYRLSLEENEAGNSPGIAEVRQVFREQADIVEKHWSGKLNAPENRPYDEMAGITSHYLIEWEQYPIYERGTVKLQGKLLGGAVFQDVDLKNPLLGSLYRPNFTISAASEHGFIGSILPGSEWVLEPEDAEAHIHHYYPATNTFVLEFRFPQVLGNPSDYAVIVWGFQDDRRIPLIGRSVDVLGYARIRAE